jgi:diphthine-ammonia ligase
MRVVVNWSGGKDCCLACYDAVMKGYEVSTLLNFVFTDYGNFAPYSFSNVMKYMLTDVGRNTAHKISIVSSLILRAIAKYTPNRVSDPLKLMFRTVGRHTPVDVTNVIGAVRINASRRMVPHEVSPEIVALQAQAMGKPIIQRQVTWDTFDAQFKKAIREMDRKDVEGGIVWGMIPPDTLLDHPRKMKKYMNLKVQYDWINKLCLDLGVNAIMPLLEKTPNQLLRELVEKKFEAIVAVVNPEFVDEKWLGHEIDQEYINEVNRLSRKEGMHVAGDEYHSLVLDCPLFKKRIKVLESRKVSKDGYSILEISKAELVSKDENSGKQFKY